MYKVTIANCRPIGYTIDEENKVTGAPAGRRCSIKGVRQMKLHMIMQWMRGIIQRDEDYGLPEDVYNDVMPSGVHEFQRTQF